MADEDKPGAIVSRNTLVPIGGAIAIFIALLTHYAWIRDQFESLKTTMNKLEYKLDQQSQVIRESITRTEMQLWIERGRANGFKDLPDFPRKGD